IITQHKAVLFSAALERNEVFTMANNTNSTNIIPINTSKDISVYVPFGGESVDLGEEAMVPAPEYLSLQYAIGLPAQRPKLDGNGHEVYDEDTGEQVVENLYYAGFFTQCGVDKNLDEAMKKNGIPWIDIVHGNGEVVRHWMIDKPSVFLMAKSIPSNANSNGQYGIVYQWRQKRNSTKSETVFYAQVIIRNLLPDYQKPFVLTVKSTQTGDILNAIRKQYKVLAKARELIRQTGRDIALPLWTYSFMLGASKKQVQRGEEG